VLVEVKCDVKCDVPYVPTLQRFFIPAQIPDNFRRENTTMQIQIFQFVPRPHDQERGVLDIIEQQEPGELLMLPLDK
jgi:hypothetical protein